MMHSAVAQQIVHDRQYFGMLQCTSEFPLGCELPQHVLSLAMEGSLSMPASSLLHTSARALCTIT